MLCFNLKFVSEIARARDPCADVKTTNHITIRRFRNESQLHVPGQMEWIESPDPVGGWLAACLQGSFGTETRGQEGYSSRHFNSVRFGAGILPFATRVVKL